MPTSTESFVASNLHSTALLSLLSLSIFLLYLVFVLCFLICSFIVIVSLFCVLLQYSFFVCQVVSLRRILQSNPLSPDGHILHTQQ